MVIAAGMPELAFFQILSPRNGPSGSRNCPPVLNVMEKSSWPKSEEATPANIITDMTNLEVKGAMVPVGFKGKTERAAETLQLFSFFWKANRQSSNISCQKKSLIT